MRRFIHVSATSNGEILPIECHVTSPKNNTQKKYYAQFWKELLKSFRFMKYTRNREDRYLYFRWFKGELVIWISWVDDCLLTGPKKRTQQAESKIASLFECDGLGDMR